MAVRKPKRKCSPRPIVAFSSDNKALRAWLIADAIGRGEATLKGRRWLRDYLRCHRKIGRANDSLSLLALRVRPKARGQHGVRDGEQEMIFLAREVWIYSRLRNLSVTEASHQVSRSEETARLAYYRYMRPGETRHIFTIELKRHYLDDPARWSSLATSQDVLDVTLAKLSRGEL